MWIVALSDPLPTWLSTIHIFKSDLWLATLIAYVMVVCIIFIMGKHNLKYNPGGEYQKFQRLPDIAFIVWHMTIACAASITPRSTHIRLVIFCWAVLSLNWYTAFTSSFISLLTIPKHANKVFITQTKQSERKRT